MMRRAALAAIVAALLGIAGRPAPGAAQSPAPSPSYSAQLVNAPELGDPAPRFSLAWADRDRVSAPGFEYNLRQDAGQVVVLVFYPQDWTPSGNAMVQNMARRHDEIAGAGAVLYGVAPDSATVHQRFARYYDLPFRLLSDPGLKVARAYGVALPFGQNRRSAYVIGRDGTVVYRDPDFAPEGAASYDALIRAVRRATAPERAETAPAVVIPR